MAIDIKFPGWITGKTPSATAGTSSADFADAGRQTQAGATIMEDLRRGARGGPQSTRLPVIGNLPIARQFQILAIGLVGFFVLAALMALVSGRMGTQNAAATGAATEMQMLSQRLARGSALTSIGNKEGFKQVQEARDRFRSNLDALTKGGVVRGVDVGVTSDSAAQEILTDISQRWEKIEQNASTLLTNEASITALSGGVESINQGNPILLELTEQGATMLQQAGASTRDLGYANQLVMLTQRIAKNANTLTAGDEIDPEVSFLLGKDVGTFRDIVTGFLTGSEALRIGGLREGDARQTYLQIKQRFGDYEGRINGILQSMQKLVAAKQAARTINVESEPLLEKSRALSDAYGSERRAQNITAGLAVLFALLALACLAVLGKVFLDNARSRASDSEQENRRNQEAILRLLNEMGTLADGDLTVKASVTEDVTGAIADSINFTVEELRNVVVGINSSTEEVSKATAQTQAISDRLFEASQRQSVEIQQASASVLQMAQSINEVSLSAAQSARVAQQSLAAAEKGAVAVQNQISGMNDIRGQIQETSKRIKRLGESSLEIGEIVELISDITEQTNVLALNAAIQAASAGEAGRGFSIVAEEVQRLAERSGDATRQIAALVKTIQTDTQDAVGAMERSTQGVVEGTRLSDAAGTALGEIDRVSRQLSELIAHISSQALSEAESANVVAANIQHIFAVTEQTGKGTRSTAQMVRELSLTAEELKQSVARFKIV